MRRWLIFVFTPFLLCAAGSSKLDRVYVGTVESVEIVGVTEDLVLTWCRTSYCKEYFIHNRKAVPYLFVGDSLFAWYLDYRMIGVGAGRGIYAIVK